MRKFGYHPKIELNDHTCKIREGSWWDHRIEGGKRFRRTQARSVHRLLTSNPTHLLKPESLVDSVAISELWWSIWSRAPCFVPLFFTSLKNCNWSFSFLNAIVRHRHYGPRYIFIFDNYLIIFLHRQIFCATYTFLAKRACKATMGLSKRPKL